MFWVFFDFIVSIFWYTITMKNNEDRIVEYDYRILQGELRHDQIIPN